MSDCTYHMTIKNGGDSRAAPIISKVIHFPAAELAIIIGKVTLGDTGLMAWSTKFRKYQDIVRDDVTLEINNAGQTTRKITVKETSVLSYNETYDATDGLGRFELVIQRHFCGEQEYFYIPVNQKDGNMKHIAYRLDTLCLESLNELTLHWSDQAKKTDYGQTNITHQSLFHRRKPRRSPQYQLQPDQLGSRDHLRPTGTRPNRLHRPGTTRPHPLRHPGPHRSTDR